MNFIVKKYDGGSPLAALIALTMGNTNATKMEPIKVMIPSPSVIAKPRTGPEPSV